MHGWSHEALIHELLVVTRRAFTPWPGTELIERPGWLQIITPTLRDGGLNEVMFSDLDRGEADADAQIDAAIARYRAEGIRFRWTVTPGCTPADLGERLERRGLERVELLGMVGATADFAEQAERDPNITVERVDASNRAAFLDVLGRGWDMDPSALEGYTSAQLEQPDRATLFLARYAGQPAAAAGATLFERSMLLQGGVVLPEFRQRGLYRALTQARMRDAATRGISLATTHAMASTSAPLLRRFGFREIVRFSSYGGR